MNNCWLSYPDHTPSETDTEENFMVIIPNPRVIRKQGYYQAPEFIAMQAIWIGNKFVTPDWRGLDVKFYYQLPPLKEENMTATQQLRESFQNTWPPLIAREKIAEYTGGLYTAGTMAAYDARGTGVPNPVRINGRKIAYNKEELINWIISKMEAANASENK